MTEFFACCEAAVGQASLLLAFVGESGAELEDASSHVPFNPLVMLAIAIILVLLNGFFVAAEFAMVKVRISKSTRWLSKRRCLRARQGGWHCGWTTRCPPASWGSRWLPWP